ncbi:hypothetical protein ACFY6U_48285 [Streptomyces sp. NPDC013157]|uniref:hypothetical protein n=1 Tax=Streptomyces sp. NPDC013157 TaxID=3364861 RepID=UPI0036C0C4F5
MSTFASLRQYSLGRAAHAWSWGWISGHQTNWSTSVPSGKGSSGTSRAKSWTTGTMGTAPAGFFSSGQAQ